MPVVASRGRIDSKPLSKHQCVDARIARMPSEDELEDLFEWGRVVGKEAGLTEEKLTAIRKSVRQQLYG